MKRKLLAIAASAVFLLTGCTTGATYDGYVHAECAPASDTPNGKVTTCSATEKPIPTATQTVPVPGPTVTVTETVTPSATATATETQTPPAVCPAFTNPSAIALPPANTDHREWMHGMDIVKHNGKDLVVFSSNNYLPTNPGGGEWVHNIYTGALDVCNPSSFAPSVLVNAPLAQEPASAAVNSAGSLLVTAEDAQFSEYLDQTFGIWNSTLGPLKAYGQKLMSPQGGHSGHAAASGERFGVTFSDGWVDGGGVDGMGTGDDVFFKAVDPTGNQGMLINVAVGSNRDWWPVVAGSDNNYLVVWQRYGTAQPNSNGTGGKVMGAIVDQSGKIIKPAFDIFTSNKYYFHDVQYIPSTGQYLVVGSQNKATNAGVAVLLNKDGSIVSTTTNLPNTIREGQTVINAQGTKAVYPGGTGAVVLDLTPANVTFNKQVAVNWNWDYMGTDGVFVGNNRVVFATGTQQGVKFLNVDF